MSKTEGNANYGEDSSSGRGITKRRAMQDAPALMRDFARSSIRRRKTARGAGAVDQRGFSRVY
ncbi:MAG: hypothetical protein LBS37_09975 [Treponema sp.]|nr:hypothetical protein [Treponema sp.]